MYGSRFTVRALLGLLAACCLEGWSEAAPGLFPPDLFDKNGPIRRLRIQISKTNLIGLIKDHRTYVPVTIEEGGRVYTNVALRLKGNEDGSFRPLYDKPAMTVNFDRFERGQLFHGYDKLYLNNSVEDGTYMHEVLCGELFRAAGIPAPRVAFAIVELNGRSRGFYVLKEGFNKRFLRRYFRDADGNFYDGGFVADIYEDLRRSSGDGPDDNADLKAVIAAARERDPQERWERLSALVDMDRFISFMAMEVLTGHWDGYTMNRNNYRIYHDPKTDRMVFLPHGMDIMFSDPDSPPAPYMDGLVSRAVIETPEGNRRYHARISELLTNVFDGQAITNRIRELQARVRPVLKLLKTEDVRKHDAAVAELWDDVTRRLRYARNWVFSSEPVPLLFNDEGVASLEGWLPRDDTDAAVLDRPAAGSGGSALHIGATDEEDARPSWRLPVYLPPGRYEFRGRLRTEGVAARTFRFGDGAGVRVAGGATRREGLKGDNDWTDVMYAFEVEPGVRLEEVELVCELLATDGEAWFDLDSLRLMRREGPRN